MTRLAITLLAMAFALVPATKQERASDDRAEPVYAQNPDDAWNRIFHCLFSRQITFRYSSEFPEGAPFGPSPYFPMLPSAQPLQVSTGTFQRYESGDRAIDPLYPIDFAYPNPYAGVREILSDPLYVQLTRALRDAQNDPAERSPLARAMMQSDLWSAFDILDAHPLRDLADRRETLLGMIAELVKKLTLTRAQIESLPNNLALTAGEAGLPRLLAPETGWIEVEWLPLSEHAFAAGYRRVSRVFIKPAHPPADTQGFLDSLRDPSQQNPAVLDGAAIVTQLICIDSQGELVPSPVTTQVELRLFTHSNDVKFKSARSREFDISRALILSRGTSRGFVVREDDAPAYLASAGNDYGFASRMFTHTGADAPLLVKQRTRCATCHGSDLTGLMTFSTKRLDVALMRHVKQLNSAMHDSADFVIAQKTARRDWKDLLDYTGLSAPR